MKLGIPWLSKREQRITDKQLNALYLASVYWRFNAGQTEGIANKDIPVLLRELYEELTYDRK